MLERDTNLVNISPGVSVLSVFRHLNYKSWYALAEFVDNAIQSADINRSGLERADGPGYGLRVSIDVDFDISTITIEDNAGGINEQDFARALRTAQLPPDRTGLAEFGVGLKSAAFWFARRWSVTTSALGEAVQRTVEFDIDRIVKEDLSELPIQVNPARMEAHFTRIVLSDVYQMPRGRTLGKIKEHLQSIYRKFLRSKRLAIIFEGRVLEFKEVPILVAAPQWDIEASPVIWKKSISFSIGQDMEVSGFAALRERGSTSDAGFALFRRGRLIQGSADDAYRPEQVFGRPNSFRSQRLFGELDLSGFEVTHTKDGFRWEEFEAEFLDALSLSLNSKDMALLDQADDFRVNRVARATTSVAAAVNVVSEQLAHLARDGDPSGSFDDEETLTGNEAVDSTPSSSIQINPPPQEVEHLTFEYADHKYIMEINLVEHLPNSELFTVSQDGEPTESAESAVVRINVCHPFLAEGPDNKESTEQIYEFIVATCVAELCARQAGIKNAGSIRRHLNSILSERR